MKGSEMAIHVEWGTAAVTCPGSGRQIRVAGLREVCGALVAACPVCSGWPEVDGDGTLYPHLAYAAQRMA